MTQFMTIKQFSTLSGYSEAATRTKISRGVWLENKVWVRSPDGRVLIDIEGYNRWVTGRESAPVVAQVSK